MAERFGGKVALVTGAGAGIGAATARAFAAEGAAVAVVDLALDAAQAVAGEIEATGGRAIAAAADVGRAADAERAVGECVDAFDGVDVLVNNAGVVRYGELPDLSEADWDLMLDTNLKGPFLMSKHAIPAIRRRGGGAIVNLASVQAVVSQPLVAAYAASKGGVVALTRTMAIDHAKDGIRVNCVLPGSVRTPMLRYGADLFAPEDPDGAIEAWGHSHPIDRVIEPAEVARVILFLASDDAAAVTGAPHFVDGGLAGRAAN
jgi:NAD(P)-dependent dehydrogenase (short-subunit alcohol dehydrogenase family)